MPQNTPNLNGYTLNYAKVDRRALQSKSSVVQSILKSVNSLASISNTDLKSKTSSASVVKAFKFNITSNAKIYTPIDSNARIMQGNLHLKDSNVTVLNTKFNSKITQSSIVNTQPVVSINSFARIFVTNPLSKSSEARLVKDLRSNKSSNAVIYTSFLDGYNLLWSLRFRYNISSQSQVFITQASVKNSNATIIKNLTQDKQSEAQIIVILGSDILSNATIENPSPIQNISSKASVVKEFIKHINSSASLLPVTGFLSIRNSQSSTVKSIIKNISSNSLIQAHFLDGYTLISSHQYVFNKESKSTIETQKYQNINSEALIILDRSKISFSSILETFRYTQTSNGSISKESLRTISSNGFIFNPDELLVLDGYNLRWTQTNKNNIQSLSRVVKLFTNSIYSNVTLIKTLTSTISSHSALHQSIESSATLIPYAPGSFSYDDETFSLYDVDAYYDRSGPAKVSFASVGKLSLKSIQSLTRLSIQVLKTISSFALTEVRYIKNITSASWIEPVSSIAKDTNHSPLFIFDIKERKTINVYDMDLTIRVKEKVMESSPVIRMKPIIRTYQLDSQIRGHIKVFGFNLIANKVFKKKTSRGPIFTFDLVLRDKE